MKNKFIIFLILLAVLSGLFWGLLYERDPSSGSGEAFGYDQLAVRLLEKGMFFEALVKGTSNDRPFYPVFLAGIYKVFGHHYRAVTLVQIFLFVLIVFLVYRLCQMLFNEKIARWAGIFTAFCYSIASFSGWIYREVLFTFFIVLLIYCLYKSQLTLKNIWFIALSLVAALALLTNSIIQLFLPIIIVNFFIVCRHLGFKKILQKLGLMLIVFALVISPWLIKDFLSFGGAEYEGMILRQKVEKMESLYGKFWQHFLGNTLGDFFACRWFKDYNPWEIRHGVKTWERYSEWIEQGKDPAIINQVLLEEAEEKIFRPVLFLEQTLIDFFRFNTPMVPNVPMQHMFVGTHPELSDLARGSIILFIRFIYLIFFVLIVYAIIKKIRNWSKISWLILIVLYFNSVFSLFTAIARNSVPVYPFYVILFAVGLVSFWNRLKHKDENLFSDQ